MREAIGGTWLFTIVILFVMLFTGYLCLAVNYSRAYNVKNGIVDIIERQNGYNDIAKAEIDEYLQDVGYKTLGKCDDGFTGNLNDKGYGYGESYYCYRSINIEADSTYQNDSATGVYYQVQVFFRIDLPIFRDLFTFRVTGDSKQLYFP